MLQGSDIKEAVYRDSEGDSPITRFEVTEVVKILLLCLGHMGG